VGAAFGLSRERLFLFACSDCVSGVLHLLIRSWFFFFFFGFFWVVESFFSAFKLMSSPTSDFLLFCVGLRRYAYSMFGGGAIFSLNPCSLFAVLFAIRSPTPCQPNPAPVAGISLFLTPFFGFLGGWCGLVSMWGRTHPTHGHLFFLTQIVASHDNH